MIEQHKQKQALETSLLLCEYLVSLQTADEAKAFRTKQALLQILELLTRQMREL